MVLWHFPYSENKEKALDIYKESLISAIEHISKKKKTYFMFFPHSID
jgi:hypothetical protein